MTRPRWKPTLGVVPPIGPDGLQHRPAPHGPKVRLAFPCGDSAAASRRAAAPCAG